MNNRRRKRAPDATASEKKADDHVRGVYGLWPLDILPYVEHIHVGVDYMHTANNVISDSLDSVRPTASHKAGLYFKHNNRTYDPSVIQLCLNEGTFVDELGPDNEHVPPWVISEHDCISIDRSMNRIIGAYCSDDVPTFIMRKGHCKKSHDTIQWCNTFARWCLRDRGVYMDNILDIFEDIARLNSSSIIRIPPKGYKDTRHEQLLNHLIVRQGLVPPSECQVTLHELMHISSQIPDIGPPRLSTLFKFERINKLMKSCVRNKAKGMPSIMKNFTQHEHYIFNFSYSLQNMLRLKKIGKYQPHEVPIMNGLAGHLHNIHVDTDEEEEGTRFTMYDLAHNNLLELRGNVYDYTFSALQLHHVFMLIRDVMEETDTIGVLGKAFDEYDIFMDTNPRSIYKYNFQGYLEHVFLPSVAEWVEAQEHFPNIQADYKELLQIATHPFIVQ
jgi:hypothetical protein